MIKYEKNIKDNYWFKMQKLVKLLKKYFKLNLYLKLWICLA